MGHAPESTLFYGYIIPAGELWPNDWEDPDQDLRTGYDVGEAFDCCMGSWGYLQEPEWYVAIKATVRETDWNGPLALDIGTIFQPGQPAWVDPEAHAKLKAFAEQWELPYDESKIGWLLVAGSAQG